MSSSASSPPPSSPPGSPRPSASRDANAVVRDVPIDWESLEDAFENNAPEVHSYLHVPTGDVLRIVDGVADPQMHARIAADTTYLRIEPVSSREQYRWMERYIPMVEDKELQSKLARAIDGKGAFRRFKDVLMSYGPERERWFAFRSERLRIFMEAWLSAHALNPVKRPSWAPEPAAEEESAPAAGSTEPREPRASRSSELLRKSLLELGEALGPRELEMLVSFGEFLKSRRAGRRNKLPGPRPSVASDPSRKPGTTLASATESDRDWDAPATVEDDKPSSATTVAAKRTSSGE